MSRRRPEAKLERDVLLRLGRVPELALYRNEVGEGFYGAVLPILRKELARHPSALAIVESVLVRNRLRYGLGPGSPDLVGILGGAAGGRFLGFELKTEGGRLEPTQGPWHAAARAKGALVEVVRSVEEAEAVIERELASSQEVTMGAGGERPQPRGDNRGERHGKR